MDTDTKPAISSLTIQGALISIVSVVIAGLTSKIPLDDNTKSALSIAIVGALMSIAGRIKAVKEISGIFKSS